nr:MAG TPA: hypothetical protein [Caudoviricetes sp.]
MVEFFLLHISVLYRLYSMLSIVFVDFFLLLSGGHHDNI